MRIYKIKLKAVALLLLSFVAVMPAGCSQGQAGKAAHADRGAEQSADESGLDVIRLVSPATTGVSVYHIAERLGYFREAGIKPEFVGTVESGKQVSSVIAGKLDVGGAHVNRTIAAISNGAKVTAVVAGTETKSGFPHMTFAVLKDSPIKEPKDIIGKRYGTSAYGGCMEYTPYDWMRLNGIDDPKGRIELVIIPTGQEILALRQRQVDFISLSTDPDYTFKNEPDLRELFNDNEVWGEVGGATPLYFSNDFIKKKPDVVRRFVGAVAKANNWIDDHMEEAIEITSKDFNIPKEKVTIKYYARDGIIKEDSIRLWIDALNYYKEIRPGIKAEDIYTNEFNPFYKEK